MMVINGGMPANERPMCPICQPPRRHWKGEPHKFGDNDAPSKHVPSKPPQPSARTENSVGDHPAAPREYQQEADRADAAAAERSSGPRKAARAGAVISSTRDRAKYNEYQAAYQRDLRSAKKLGLTVAQYRARKRTTVVDNR